MNEPQAQNTLAVCKTDQENLIKTLLGFSVAAAPPVIQMHKKAVLTPCDYYLRATLNPLPAVGLVYA